MRRLALSLAFLLTLGFARAGDADDPLAAIYESELQPSLQSLLDDYRDRRLYSENDFPMAPKEFGEFRRTVVERLLESLQLEHWATDGSPTRSRALGALYKTRVLRTIERLGVRMEVRVIELSETGDIIPAVVCLPPGEDKVPGIVVSPGHSRNSLRDLVVNLENRTYKGLATRLAQAGFATIAIEKIDAGYLSRSAPSGVDEAPLAIFRLGLGLPTRTIQLRAGLAASEILAAHPRVDASRMGATGVSLGGWLSVQTALLSQRIRAVADLGVKSVYMPQEMAAADIPEAVDVCHILPGMFAVGDRNLLTLAYAPRPLLAGHGSAHKSSAAQADRYFRRPLEAQYDTLGASEQLRYLVHPGGDEADILAVVGYFREVFSQ